MLGRECSQETFGIDLLIHEYDFLSLVEQPGLLRTTPGWLLEPGKPAQMAAPLK
jgi:hypothetical protein